MILTHNAWSVLTKAFPDILTKTFKSGDIAAKDFGSNKGEAGGDQV